MQKTAMSMLLISMLCSSAAVWAAGPMKAGLWEMTMKSSMMKDMPKIPPEQMEKMREMGIEIPQMKEGGMVTKVCISKEMAERDQPPHMDQTQSGCQSKNFQRTGNSYSVDIICDGGTIKGEGKAQGTFVSGESFTSTYDFKGVAVHGHPINDHHETSGKWLSADCGKIAPMGMGMGKPAK